MILTLILFYLIYSVEIMREVGSLVDKHGFPVAFGISMLILIAILFRYFMRTIEKKDCDFKDYAEKRDGQFITLSEKHIVSTNQFAEAINNNTMAIQQWSNTNKHRAGQSKVTAALLKDVVHELKENPPTGAIQKPETEL